MRWWVTAAILTALPACGGGGAYSAGGAMAPEAATAGADAFGGGSGEMVEGDYGVPQGEAMYVQAGPGAAENTTTPPGQASPSPTTPPTADDAHRGPLLVYTANLQLAVHQVSEKQGMIEALAQEAGGHLAERTGNRIRVRVPAANFERVLAAIIELGDVMRREVSVQDVTEEFHDLSLRIRTLEAMYARVRQLLEEAENVEDALAVERHLQRITMELEQLRGRLRFLSDRLAYSTITVLFQERTTVAEPTFALPIDWLRSLGLEELMRLQ